jgi:hypothetical protein
MATRLNGLLAEPQHLGFTSCYSIHMRCVWLSRHDMCSRLALYASFC